MLSRVADSLYWMSRYLERAENTLRQLDVTMNLMLDPGEATTELRWSRLVEALGSPAGMEWNGNLDAMAREVIFNKANPSSVIFCLSAARENARQVRDEISSEQWLRLNRLFHHIQSTGAKEQYERDSGEMLASVMDGIHLFKGVSDTTMIHGPGWQFIRLGRYLERVYATATLLEVFQAHHAPVPDGEKTGYEYLEQVGLLRCCTAFEAYCQVYTADIVTERILEFLLLNRHFPHAIRYAVESVSESMQAISASGSRRSPDELLACVGRLSAMLSYTTIGEVLRGGATPFLHSLRQQSMLVHNVIYRHYVHYSIQSALSA
ncbi:MAG TPA: alpha-E domain-containing protein [Terracidiphilus sp.]